MSKEIRKVAPLSEQNVVEWNGSCTLAESVSSSYKIGCDYDIGRGGVEQDYVKAFEWFLKGADEGCLESIHNIGYFYYEGRGVEQDYQKAMEWSLKSAERGCAKSQFNIGIFYDKGRGVEQDYKKAFEWYLKAAENGDAEAQYNVAVYYENGLGVEQDDVKAVEWYLKSAESNIDAQFNIADFYEKGKGVEQDDGKAFEWYLKSAENGHKLAQFNVGCYFEGGEVVEKDMKEALYWQAKGLNEVGFSFVEPYNEWYQFGLEQLKNCDDDYDSQETDIPIESLEQVIIRFSENDFKVSNNLSNSKYLSTMLNSNWRDLNEKDGNEIILDLRPIENSIFEDETNHIQIFELYFNYLTRYELPNDCEFKLKLIELSRYLGDDECILRIMRDSSLLLRFYILFKFEMIEPIHIAIASCYITESSETLPFYIEELSENALEVLLTQSKLSELAKKEILCSVEKCNLSVSDNNTSIHLTFNQDILRNEINFNNNEIILSLEEYANEEDETRVMKIDGSDNFQIFGENAKFYIQLDLEDETVVGFWFESNADFSNFNIPLCDFLSIHLVIITCD